MSALKAIKNGVGILKFAGKAVKGVSKVSTFLTVILPTIQWVQDVIKHAKETAPKELKGKIKEHI